MHNIIIIIIIIIALDNTPYKMLNKLKSACFAASEKTNSEQVRLIQVVLRKSLDQQSKPLMIQQMQLISNNWDQQQQWLCRDPNAILWFRHNKLPREPRSQSRLDQKLLNPQCKKQQGKPERRPLGHLNISMIGIYDLRCG